LALGQSHHTASVSNEEFDVDVTDEDNSEIEDDFEIEDGNLPVHCAGGLPSATTTKMQINDPSTLGRVRTWRRMTKTKFFFKLVKMKKGLKRKCRYCM
jgi:hypothetical protein